MTLTIWTQSKHALDLTNSFYHSCQKPRLYTISFSQVYTHIYYSNIT